MPVTFYTVRTSLFLPRHSQDNDTSLCHDAGCFSYQGLSMASIWPPAQPLTLPHQSSVDCAIYAFLLAGSCSACRSARSCLQLLEVNPGCAWITCGGQCAVTRDLGLLPLLPQGIHTGLVLSPFIGLGGHLGQPINLRARSPLLFLTFHIVTRSNTSVFSSVLTTTQWSTLITGRGYGSDLVA